MIALVDAINSIKKELPDPQVYPLVDSVAAISVGIVDGKPVSRGQYQIWLAQRSLRWPSRNEAAPGIHEDQVRFHDTVEINQFLTEPPQVHL